MRASLVAAVLTVIAGSVAGQVSSAAIAECRAVALTDRDADGLSDACELGLASAFAPILVVRTQSCNWDSSVRPARLGGGYFHAVQQHDSLVRIAYLPAYFRDCGWSGAKCRIPWIDCSPHNGDSEMIVADVRRDGHVTWSITALFLSAHCFGRSTGSCRWYRDAELQAFEWVGAAPVVWVSDGRQANYPSWRACDEGHHALDTCDRHDVSYRFPIAASRNIGSRALPAVAFGCVRGAALESDAVEAAAEECFWQAEAMFRGWQGSGRGVTPYSRYLREVAGF